MKRKINLSVVIAFTCISLAQLAISEAIGAPQESTPIEPLTPVIKSSVTAPEIPNLRIVESYGQLPLSFEANQGQVDDSVEFLSRGRGYSLLLTPTESILILQKTTSADIHHGKEFTHKSADVRHGRAPTYTEPSSVLRMKLVGANPAPKMTGLDQLSGKVNYLIGNDPKKWHTNIPTYAKVRYQNVYPGVDLVYYGNQGQLEYDFVVAPSTDPKTINLDIEGTDKIELDAQGNLVLHAGDEQVRLYKPLVYQEVEGVRQEVPGGYVLKDKRNVVFQVAAYDASKSLIIDPVLDYSTYLGGSGDDRIYAIATDAEGNAYVAGNTNSIVLPAPPPPYPLSASIPFQPTLAGGTDAFVAKLNADGSALVYGTYLGGIGNEHASSITVDAYGSVYVAGGTESSDFPITSGAFDSVFKGPAAGFVTKLDPSGSNAEYSTYLGGEIYAILHFYPGIAIDTDGSAYVTGPTYGSRVWPTTSGAFDEYCLVDGFVSKLNPAGTNLEYSTCFGGSTYDYPADISVDESGHAYVVGETFSADFPTTPGAFDTDFNEGRILDVFVTKLSSDGTALEFSTYLGGEDVDDANGIAVDAVGNAYVVGNTYSRQFPTTPGAFDTSFDESPPPYGTYRDGFVTKLRSDGSALEYSTFLGGPFAEFILDVAVDTTGNVYVTGNTHGDDFPLTPDALDIMPSTIYGFLTKFNPSGSALEYSTFLGGGGRTFASTIAMNASDNIYIAGYTEGTNFITLNPLQPTIGGGWDGFIAKWIPNVPPVANAGPPQSLICTSLSGTPVTLYGSDSSDPDDDSLTYTWTGPFLEGSGTAAGVGPTVTIQIGTSIITLVVNDGSVDSDPDTVEITITCTPVQHIGLMIDHVNALVSSKVLSKGRGNSLTRKLVDALKHLEKGNTHAAIQKLQEFISVVEGYIRTGKLPSADGQLLLDAAHEVILNLNS